MFLKRFLFLSVRKKKVLMEALLEIMLAKIMVSVFDFKHIAKNWEKPINKELLKKEVMKEDEVNLISWSIRTVSRYFPRMIKCLEKASAGKRMLKRRGWMSDLYLGVAKDGPHKLKAHAWVKRGNKIVTGNAGIEAYRVLAVFREKK